MLHFLLFGAPRIERDAQAVPLRRTKALALLAYLAITRQPQDRDTLLALLWPEFDAASARNNLRRELSLLKTVLDEELLVADRLQVAWNPQAQCWLDVTVFQEQLAVSRQHQHPPGELCAACAEALTTAARLYTDDFMAGFSVPDCPAFDDWQFFQREELRQNLAEVLQALIGWHARKHAYDPAVAYARRWLALDPLHEPAHRELMRLYAWSGHHAAAVRQYEECVRVLDRELGVEPEAETTRLYAQIRSREFAMPDDKETGSPDNGQEPGRAPVLPVSASAKPNLPAPTTEFVGRQREVADIIRRLTDPACRLLTVTGPGGIGKTRLALQAAQMLVAEWSGEDAIADGVLCVPLADVRTESEIVSALAAAWLKVLSVEQVVGKLEHGLDILTTRDSNMPGRHHSMRIVLEQSWSLLTAAEQQTLARLSVFCSGFSLEAAEVVAGAALDALANLVEKSLLRTVTDGRFQMHELLRQFAAEKLAADQSTLRTTRERHSAYYLAFLAEREARLLGPDQHAAVAEIAREADNMRMAWTWAIDHDAVALIDRALYSYFLYYLARSYFQEGDEIFGLAAAVTPDAGEPAAARVYVRALIRRGAFRRFLGDYQSAVHYTECGLNMADELGLHSDVAFAYLIRGGIAVDHGDTEVAQQQLSAALTLSRKINDKPIVVDALYELARLYGSNGDYTESKRLAQESLAISRSIGRLDWIAHALRTLAYQTLYRGEYNQAEVCFRESLELFESIDNQSGVADALGGLGLVAWCVGDTRLTEARQYHEQSLSILRRLGLRLFIADKLSDLAVVALDSGDYTQAEAMSQEGLAQAYASGAVACAVFHLCIIGHSASMRAEFAFSRQSFREALGNIGETQLWPILAFTFYYVAALLGREASFVGQFHPASVSQLE